MEYLSFLKEHSLTLAGIVPCFEEEVKNLEFRLKCTLPKVYKEFLLIMGKNSGSLFQGIYVSYDDLLFFREEASKILQRNNSHKKIKIWDVVFLIHQGYQFMFFKCNEGEDPPVYFYDECKEQVDFVELYPSFSSFIKAVLEQVSF